MNRSTIQLAALASVILVGVFASGLLDGRQSHSALAQSNDPNPRGWAADDMRMPTQSQILRSVVRAGVVCKMSSPGLEHTVEGLLMKAANSPVLNPADASSLACFAGFPADATCDQVRTCTGDRGQAAQTPACDGSVLRTVTINHGSRQRSPVAVTCRAFGDNCYATPVGGFCGSGFCEPGQTYGCDGDTITACVHGVNVRTPCGRGMTCGRAAGSHVVDCVAKGPECKESRCDGDTLHQCMKDSFGGGRERVVDCQSFGLVCSDDAGGACVPPTVATDCSPKDPARCADGAIEVCIARHWKRFSCGELGLGGKCGTSESGSIVCQ